MTNKFCQTQRPYFSDHLDGQPIPFWRKLMVRWHMAMCPLCIRYNRSLVATRDALSALRDADIK